MADPGELRVSDQDRERVASELRDHFAAGRISDDELSERLEAAYQARTARELEALRVDLPAAPASRAEERAQLARRRGDLRRRLVQQSGGAVIVFLICTVVWVAGGAGGQFWPIWVALLAAIPLLRNGWRLYGPAPDLDSVERELARREARERRHGGHPRHGGHRGHRRGP
jgi:DUF1707 SHOCT-like domain